MAPFPALRYDVSVAGDPATTSAPAYDELQPAEFARHRIASPYTVLQLLTRAPVEQAPYGGGASAYARWRRTGVLVEEAQPRFYRYDQHVLRRGVPHLIRGLLAAVRVEPLSTEGSVFAHEQVEPARVRDRLERLLAVPVDVSPVFAVYRDAPGAISDLLDRLPPAPPLVACTDESGTDHRIWAVDRDAAAQLRRLFAPVRVVIADGHHRYATALALQSLRHSGNAGGGATAARTLMYLVDAHRHGPQVLAVHRILRRLHRDALARLASRFVLQPGSATLPALLDELERAPRCAFALHTRNEGFIVVPRDEHVLRAALRSAPGEDAPAWCDVALLEHGALPLLGVEAVEYTADAESGLARAANGGALVLLRPVDVDTILDLAFAGQRLPAKTTSFRPKPRAGLLLRPLDDLAPAAAASDNLA